jgi:hypothetical protein
MLLLLVLLLLLLVVVLLLLSLQLVLSCCHQCVGTLPLNVACQSSVPCLGKITTPPAGP